MAWPQFMSTSFPSSANTDHTLKPSIYFLNAAADLPANNGFRSGGMGDHLLQNLYEGEATGQSREVSSGGKGSAGDGSGFREVTLEDYLTKARVVRAEDVKKAAAAAAAAAAAVSDRIGQVDLEETENQNAAAGGKERGRGRKRLAVDSADRAALQRQKRMIKNRESAARSRERKQQYTNQLEQTVFKLEEENAMLLKEREKLLNWRFKQLVEKVIPVAEQKKSERPLRRTNSFP